MSLEGLDRLDSPVRGEGTEQVLVSHRCGAYLDYIAGEHADSQNCHYNECEDDSRHRVRIEPSCLCCRHYEGSVYKTRHSPKTMRTNYF